MAGLAEALALLYSPKLTRTKTINIRGFRGWLSDGNYQPISNQNSLILVPADPDELFTCLASDISRLTMAGHETVASISNIEKLPQSAPWNLIKLYYAAFYYCQTALKLSKNWPTYFPTSDLLTLRSNCQIYAAALPFQLRTGQYEISLNDQNYTVQISKISSSNGTHEEMWGRMSKFLQSVSVLVSTSNFNQIERQQMSKDLGQLEAAIKASGFRQSWLSSLRNDVQYAQKMGVWHPYRDSVNPEFTNRRLAAMQNKDVNTSHFNITAASESERFFEQSLFVCCALRNFIALVAEREPVSFLNKAPSKLQHLLQG